MTGPPGRFKRLKLMSLHTRSLWEFDSCYRAKQSLSFKKLLYPFLSEQGMLSPGTWALITLCIPNPLQMESPTKGSMVTSEGQRRQPGLLCIHLACKMSTTKVTAAKSYRAGGNPGEVPEDRTGTCIELPFLPYISRPYFLQILNVTGP